MDQIRNILLLAVLAAVRADYCFSTDENPYRLYSTKTAYDNVRNNEPPEDETPSGCEAVHMYFIARHGSRYNKVSDRVHLEVRLTQLRDTILESPHQLCHEDVEALVNWEPLYEPFEDRTLAQRGWDEFRNIGIRYKVRVPELLDRPYEESRYHFQHTNYSGRGDRTKSTARAFVQGVWGTYDGIYLQESSQPDWLIHYYKICDKYIQTVDDVPEVEYDDFNEGPNMENVLRRMETRLGLDSMSLDFDLASDIYEACIYEYLLVNGSSPWCVAFTEDDLVVFEYSEDLHYYWQKSYPHNITYEQACPLLADMVLKFQEAIAGTGLLSAGRFGHSTTINTFFTLLGLNHDAHHLTASNFEDMGDRQWRTSLNIPMGANAAFVLYRCETLPFYRVKTLINERPTILPQCDDYVCDFADVMSTWEPIASNCDIEEICTWPEVEQEFKFSSSKDLNLANAGLILLAFCIDIFFNI